MRCPSCNSEYVFFSPRKQRMVCEDCGCVFEKPSDDRPHLRIFFSYGHDRNRVIVERIMEALRERGHDVWIDQERIETGSEWRRSITEGIMESDEVVSFMSRHSVRNPGVCLDELRIALCVRNAGVKTVLLESERDVEPPTVLASRQWLDMSDWRERMEVGGAAWDAWFEERVGELVKCLESSENATFQGELEEVRSVLNPVPYGNREHDLLQREFCGRTWLFDRTQAWKSSTCQRYFVLWGVPGSGKSAFVSHLAHYDPSVVATVFFEYGRLEMASFDAVTRLIAFQLAAKLPDYRVQLLFTIRNQRCEVDNLHDESLFDLVVGNPLRNSVDGNRAPAVVVFDAVDELCELDGCLMARLLSKLNELPSWLRVLVTARLEPGVVALFDDAASYTLGADGSDESDGDIEDYLASYVSERVMARRLARVCEGSFLYATMLRAEMQEGRITVEEALNFSGGLSSFYRINFERRFGIRSRFADVRPAIEAILGSPMLPRHLLCEALGYDTYAFLEFRRALGSFVTVTDEELDSRSARIQVLGLAHKSLADWFSDERLAGEFFVDARQGKARMGRFFADLMRREGPVMLEFAERAYIVSNVASLLVDGGCYGEYVDLMLAIGSPMPLLWGRVRDLPVGIDLTLLVELLRKSLRNVKDGIRFGSLSQARLFVSCCEALEGCVGRTEFDEVLSDLLMSKNGLWCPTHFYRSSASDCYDHGGIAYLFNEDKSRVAHAVSRCFEVARHRGVHFADSARREVQLLKLSALFIEGRFYEDGARFGMNNRPHYFRDELCELSAQDFEYLEDLPMRDKFDISKIMSFYNTYCLYLYLRGCERVTDEVKEHILRAESFGADYERACELVDEYRKLRKSRLSAEACG